MSAGYLDGFRIHYRRRRTDRYESFETVTLRRPNADAFAIRRLVEGVEYEVRNWGVLLVTPDEAIELGKHNILR